MAMSVTRPSSVVASRVQYARNTPISGIRTTSAPGRGRDGQPRLSILERALGQSLAGAQVMDFNPYESHWRESVPLMTLLEACWQMTSPRGRCADVRCVQDDRRPRGAVRVLKDDLIRSQYARELERREIAADGSRPRSRRAFRMCCPS